MKQIGVLLLMLISIQSLAKQGFRIGDTLTLLTGSENEGRFKYVYEGEAFNRDRGTAVNLSLGNKAAITKIKQINANIYSVHFVIGEVNYCLQMPAAFKANEVKFQNGYDSPPVFEFEDLIFKEGSIHYDTVIQVPGVSKEVLYERAKIFFIRAFNDAKSVVQLQDKESGHLIGKGFAERSAAVIIHSRYWFIFDVTIKDGRYKIQVYDIKIEQLAQEIGN